MSKKIFVWLLATILLTTASIAQAKKQLRREVPLSPWR